MKYATRLNSFLRVDKDLKHALEAIGKIDGVDFVDMNYPEHFADYSVPEVKQMLADNNLRCNAINLRFRDKFLHGEFGNIDRQIAEDAITLCKEATEYANSWTALRSSSGLASTDSIILSRSTTTSTGTESSTHSRQSPLTQRSRSALNTSHMRNVSTPSLTASELQ